MNQIGGHADVLASLTRVHMDGLGFGRHGGLVGQQHALRLQKAPFFRVHHGLACQRLPFGKLGPRSRYQRHSNRLSGLKRVAGSLESFGQTSPLGVVIKQWAVKREVGELGLEGFQGVVRKQEDPAFNRFHGLVRHGGGKRRVEDGRGFLGGLPAVG